MAGRFINRSSTEVGDAGQRDLEGPPHLQGSSGWLRPPCRGRGHFLWTCRRGVMAIRIGVALGSGSARGWAHIGVLRTLRAAGILPDVVCGTSIGAIVGAFFCLGRLDTLEDWARRLTRVSVGRLCDFQFGAGGLVGGRRIERMLGEHYGDQAIEHLATSFACVATDLDSGHEVWLRTGRVADAVRASYAVPGILPPVQRFDRWLVDGGLVNPVPISLCRALGATMTIAVDVRGGRFGPPPEDDDGIAANAGKRRFGRGQFRQRKGGPSAFGAFARSLQIIQDRIAAARLAEDAPDVLIAPRLRSISALEFYRAEDCIAAGEDAAMKALPAIRERIAAADHRPRAKSAVGA